MKFTFSIFCQTWLHELLKYSVTQIIIRRIVQKFSFSFFHKTWLLELFKTSVLDSLLDLAARIVWKLSFSIFHQIWQIELFKNCISKIFVRRDCLNRSKHLFFNFSWNLAIWISKCILFLSVSLNPRFRDYFPFFCKWF